MQRRIKRKPMSQINVVPYIDVMLVLLVIFMITAPMVPTGVVDLPRVSQKILKPQSSPEIIIIEKGGEISFHQEKYTLKRLDKALAKQLKNQAETAFIISADKQVNYGNVVAVMSILKERGAKVSLLLDASQK